MWGPPRDPGSVGGRAPAQTFHFRASESERRSQGASLVSEVHPCSGPLTPRPTRSGHGRHAPIPRSVPVVVPRVLGGRRPYLVDMTGGSRTVHSGVAPPGASGAGGGVWTHGPATVFGSRPKSRGKVCGSTIPPKKRKEKRESGTHRITVDGGRKGPPFVELADHIGSPNNKGYY